MIRAPLATPPSGGRIVWAGRHRGAIEGGLSGWDCPPATLKRLISRSAELVILDALSFPWESIDNEWRSVPTLIALPVLDAETLDALFGRHLQGHLTPFDRLLEARDDVRRECTQYWRVPEGCWISASSPEMDSYLDAIVARSAERMDMLDAEVGYFYAQAGDLITRHLRDFGAHQRGTLNVVTSVLQAADTLIDVGAHIGTMSIPLARHLSAGRVIAVEGDPTTAHVLEHNVRENGMSDKIRVHSCVLTDAPGPVSGEHMALNSGATSFYADRHGSVEATTLDTLLSGVDLDGADCLLKLDVEGSELAVLRGGEQFVRQRRPLIVVEVSANQLAHHGSQTSDLDRWLHDHEYDLFAITGERNFQGPGWSLREIDTLSAVESPLFDVLAIPQESKRRDTIRLEGP